MYEENNDHQYEPDEIEEENDGFEPAPEPVAKPKKKAVRKRKPNIRARINQVTKKMERISIIAGEAIEILSEVGDGIDVVEDLKKKLKEM